MSFAQLALLSGAIYGFLGVALGAFGAHGLRERLTPELLAVWKTAVEYQFYHALALLLVGLLASQRPSIALTNAGICFALGVLVFSGSLYTLALSGLRWLGAITPVGGLLLLAGWALLFWAVLKRY
ncbi:DUF423 domain-containing protein [Stagnimonas aquatica]|uniref:DUF423 domain-containing protein n=1 Tax=Stagnimonas aquatica TaxID=2689987 RepID=A0A3N0VG94_9GAMM|nr:DUF423 domain-containing protein [Stagnimonas aquatica]ROH91803.1 DUF423 domain-containing protein [Stagnimonas aquatica]